MSLRDRIARALSLRQNFRCHGPDETATEHRERMIDAILSDPEIAALRDVAMFANVMANQLRHGAYVTVRCAEDMDAALARLEEARRG